MQTKYAVLIGVNLLTSGVAGSTPVTAMTLPGTAGISVAADSASVTADAAYVCRRWRHHYRWHRRCWWTGPTCCYSPGWYWGWCPAYWDGAGVGVAGGG